MKFMNRLEIANEFLVLTSTYFLFVYSDGFLLKKSSEEIEEKVKDWEVQE